MHPESPPRATPDRILFVDDEPHVLDGLRFAMRRHRRDWEMHFAESGEEALIELRRCAFDVVVADMWMPGVDGAQLLRRVQESQPAAIRILLSAHAEADGSPHAALGAPPLAHHYLMKPCKMIELQGCIERLRSLRTLLSGPRVQEAAAALDPQPSLPGLYLELQAAMADPRVNAWTLAQRIERDAATSARVLALVNSPLFELGSRVSRVAEAITSLGFDRMKSVVLAVGLFAQLRPSAFGFDPARLQAHALRVGLLGARLARTKGEADQVFLSAVLCTLGPLVLATGSPARFARALALARELGLPRHQAERQVFGTDHAAVGALVMERWGLPAELIEAVAYHAEPQPLRPVRFGVLSCLHLAGRLLSAPATGDEIDPAYLAALGVVDELPRWRALAREIAPR